MFRASIANFSGPPAVSPADAPTDPADEWSLWVLELPAAARRVLSDPESGYEESYRELFVARKATLGSIMLELLTLAESA